MQLIDAADVVRFHDDALGAHGRSGGPPAPDHAAIGAIGAAWREIRRNHRCNASLWRHEDEARRRDVGDGAIAASKRAIVLIPTRDRPHALAMTLTTVALQTHRPLRVVVSDQSRIAAADDPLLRAALRFSRAHDVDAPFALTHLIGEAVHACR